MWSLNGSSAEYANFLQEAEIILETGAGEGIRTLDPNLGKRKT
jgi:hypothetical protein